MRTRVEVARSAIQGGASPAVCRAATTSPSCTHVACTTFSRSTASWNRPCWIRWRAVARFPFTPSANVAISPAVRASDRSLSAVANTCAMAS